MSDTALRTLRRWITTCDESHQCHSDWLTAHATSTLPTRVIDLGDALETQSRLHITNGEVGRYVTLSHVWGGLIPVRTTTETFEAYCHALPLEYMPKFFRDAMVLTKILGIRYLWIDALCIIQDSAQDWKEECGKMSRIYQGAYLVVAAPDAPNSNAGFLGERTAPLIRPAKLPYFTKNGNIAGEIWLRPYPHRYELESDYDQITLLQTRAWTLQEILLSRRTLFVGKRQIYWACGEALYKEKHATKNIRGRLSYGGNTVQGLAGLMSKGKVAAFETWYRLVEEYSRRYLTNGQDKLPALSGLANSKYLHSDYLAGHWTDDFIKSLAFKAFSRERKPADGDQPYQAPSPVLYLYPILQESSQSRGMPTLPLYIQWSWASTDGTLAFDFHPSAEDAEALSFSIALNGEDPYGGINFASITLRGRFQQANCNYTPPGDPVIHHGWHLCQPKTNALLGPFHFDQEIAIGEIDTVYCLKLLKLYECDYSSGILLLQRVEDVRQHTYRRVGYGRIWSVEFQRGEYYADGNWFDDCPFQTVTII